MEKLICIGLAQLTLPDSISHGVNKVIKALEEGASKNVDIMCFPESYIPGLRGQDFEVPSPDQHCMKETLQTISEAAASYSITAIIGMEWETPFGLHNVAFVISDTGEVLGYQAKNQIPPGEEKIYVPDGKRSIFTARDVTFGISICHEGWRYPETVRWAAVRGAQIIFHPHYTGSNKKGELLTDWGSSEYNHIMVTRSMENTIYFASVNCALQYQYSCTSLISPSGECIAHVPYGKEDLLVTKVDLSKATRLFARRYDPALYPSEND